MRKKKDDWEEEGARQVSRGRKRRREKWKARGVEGAQRVERKKRGRREKQRRGGVGAEGYQAAATK